MEQEKKQRKQNPWLSVIIPIYNAEKYLDDCLLSIARQDFKDYEVILIDDGSTDDSEKICNFYTKKDERFKYFKIKNSGSYVARIKGIQKTKGNYFTFCDSDDFYNRQAFSIIYDNLKNSKAEVLEFGYLKKFNHIKKRVRYCERKLLINQDDFIANEYPKLLCSRWENSHIDMLLWNKVYKHSLKDKIMATGDDRVFFGDDQILNLQLLENCNSILIIPNYLYFYRQGSGLTNKYSKNTLKDINTIKEWQLRFINRGEYQKKEILYKNLFGELAGWTFKYIQDSFDYLNEEQIKKILNSALKMSAFKKAKQYYLTLNSEDWNGVNLIRSGDSDKYITIANSINKKTRRKRSLKKTLRKILVSL